VPNIGKSNFPQVIERNGGDDETRTRNLCRNVVAVSWNVVILNGADSPLPESYGTLRHRLMDLIGPQILESPQNFHKLVWAVQITSELPVWDLARKNHDECRHIALEASADLRV